MRVFGRTRNVLTGKKTWWVVTTDINGFNDSVYLTALAQVIKLNLGESPFFAQYGIPAHESVVTQIFPDFYLAFTQQQYAGYFASLLLISNPVPQGSADSFAAGQDGAPAPRYYISVLTNTGARIGVTLAPDFPTEQPI
jgi:hypothetical protein